jgi:small subunit ribosomal protein S10
MIKCWKIKLQSYDVNLLESSVSIITQTALTNGWKIKGPIPLPTKKLFISFPRAPHVYKHTQEQFERLTHRRALFILNTTSDVKDQFKNLTNIPSGVQIDMEMTEIEGGNK